MASIRLDKYLADAGLGTRSEVKKLVKAGRVTIDGNVAGNESVKIDPEKNCVAVDGRETSYSEYAYYLLNKPWGILTASRDGRERTVVDLIPEPKRRDLFPVGRLDRDTVGLLLITNDGKLSNQLLAPGRHVEKTYHVLVAGTIPGDAAEHFAVGMDIGDEKPAAPAELTVRGRADEERIRKMIGRYGLTLPQLLERAEKAEEVLKKDCAVSGRTGEVPETGDSEPEGQAENPATEAEYWEVEVRLTEGRYHQVKRMFAAVGCRVIFLERKAMGRLTLPEDLEPGETIRISRADIE